MSAPDGLAVEVAVRYPQNYKTIASQYPVRIGETLPWVRQLLKTIPDENCVEGPEARRVIRQSNPLYCCSLPSGKGRGFGSDIQPDWPPSPCFGGFEKCADVAPDFHDFGMRA